MAQFPGGHLCVACLRRRRGRGGGGGGGRFAQFFIAPLLREESTEREVLAVENKHTRTSFI